MRACFSLCKQWLHRFNTGCNRLVEGGSWRRAHLPGPLCRLVLRDLRNKRAARHVFHLLSFLHLLELLLLCEISAVQIIIKFVFLLFQLRIEKVHFRRAVRIRTRCHKLFP